MSPRINFRRPTASAAGRVPGRWSNRACSLVVLMVVTVAVAASCSTDASTRTAAAADEKAPTAKAVATLEPVPAGTTLRVGDQVEYLQTLLSLSGQDKDFPYTVEYSSFIGGPPMLQAFQGGALDTGFVGSTPLIFAQAARQDIVAIAAWASENGTQATASPPIPTSRVGTTWPASGSPTSGGPQPRRACSRRSIGRGSIRPRSPRSTCPSHRSRPR